MNFMVNWFVQTIQIFVHFSIQTIRTLNFIFVSALVGSVDNAGNVGNTGNVGNGGNVGNAGNVGNVGYAGICQICQNFPPPNISCVRYALSSNKI